MQEVSVFAVYTKEPINKTRKKMKLRMMKWYNGLLSALLSMMGFESCNNAINNAAAEYGCPTVEYQVKGEVTDADSGHPIEGIQAKLGHTFTTDEYDQAYTFDSVRTDRSGAFTFPMYDDVSLQSSLTLILEDPRAASDGTGYASDTVRLKDMEQKQVKQGDGHWYNGAYELTVTRKLKKRGGAKQ